MRVVPTLFHGIVDYLVGILVIALPFFLELTGGPRVVLVILGVAVILYSFLTDYELGAVRFLRIRFHLLLDALFGISMLISPWLFDVPADRRWPVYLVGALALVLAMITQIRAEGTAATD
ncbi:hypothetical protein F4695_004007 [Rhizobium soli]|jgi:hypothetical protein|uniref:SPW repeat-containing integral membrane domain-containing protein n=1 Tax=Rhizobium soli TaxID=424798 RepID=A0A7X0MTM6_9HYPH|nr:hypothetical protein [Rhizobium soli]MBB6510616.1 hypothetical protein [Rhizobium soli]